MGLQQSVFSGESYSNGEANKHGREAVVRIEDLTFEPQFPNLQRQVVVFKTNAPFESIASSCQSDANSSNMALETIYIPMTGSAKDSLIAMSVLWLVFAAVVGFRLRGRMRGPGLGLDDLLAVVALVNLPEFRQQK